MNERVTNHGWRGGAGVYGDLLLGAPPPCRTKYVTTLGPGPLQTSLSGRISGGVSESGDVDTGTTPVRVRTSKVDQESVDHSFSPKGFPSLVTDGEVPGRIRGRTFHGPSEGGRDEGLRWSGCLKRAGQGPTPFLVKGSGESPASSSSDTRPAYEPDFGGLGCSDKDRVPRPEVFPFCGHI